GMPIWDIERVEVLRGPQGTLFGRNTPAGIVKFDSRKPTREFESHVRGSYGTFDTVDARAAISGPLSETVSARLSLLYQSRSDWVDNRAPGNMQDDALGGYDNSAWRLQFLFEPNDRFSALLNLHGWDVDGTARIFRANIIQPGTDDLVPGFEQDEVFHDGQNSQDIEAQGGVLKMDYDLGNATLTSVTGFETLEMFSRGDIDGGFGASFAPPFGPGFIPFPSETADGIPDLDQLTQEIRLTSNGDEQLDWILGAFYFDEELQADTFSFNSLAPGNPRDGFSFQKQQAESWALFGSFNYEPNEDWELQAGVRYTTDDKDFSAERPDPTFQLPTIAPIVRTTDADNVSWDVSVTRIVSDDVNVYARIATGFRAPSIQGRILFAPDFEGGTNPATNGVSVADEEEILSYEVGVKSFLAERKVRLNLTGYVYEVDGQQVVAVGGEFNVATLLNTDTTDGYGLEADIAFAPAPEWLITLGASFNHTEIDDPNLAVTPCGGGCTVLDPIGPNGALVDGNSLPHAPELIFNGIIDYRRVVGDDGLLTASVDWAYHDEKRFFLYESAEFQADSFELGARIAYAFGEAKYEIAAFGRNLTDEDILQNGIDFNNLTGMVNDPRTVGVEFRVNF
ncbi:MAG: TonB-dependent receptor, partial [Thermoanaerobaculia bacterium]|nr:TonB-dependent receptor [Thermoanaerobaculia bacterium]